MLDDVIVIVTNASLTLGAVASSKVVIAIYLATVLSFITIKCGDEKECFLFYKSCTQSPIGKHLRNTIIISKILSNLEIKKALLK